MDHRGWALGYAHEHQARAASSHKVAKCELLSLPFLYERLLHSVSTGENGPGTYVIHKGLSTQ